MEVTGPGSVGESPARPTEILPTHEVSSVVPGREEPQDETETAEAAQIRKRLHSGSRAERLAQIQAEIAAGLYETPDKLEVAVKRLLRRIR